MEKIYVMVNGLPGKMATCVAEHVLAEAGKFELVLHSLTGEEHGTRRVDVKGSPIFLYPPSQHAEVFPAIVRDEGPFIAVDFTGFEAVIVNAKLYCDNRTSFVMGTTGGDRELLTKTVEASCVSAVIAPNMAKPIIGFTVMMKYMAENFPKIFQGYTLAITESHQAKKADMSGTAKAMVGHFNAMGIAFEESQIKMIRDPCEQRIMGVPEHALNGHGWHTYELTSDDGTVVFRFVHNINGRNIYAQGTLDAVVFLSKKLGWGAFGNVFSMIDVLRG